MNEFILLSEAARSFGKTINDELNKKILEFIGEVLTAAGIAKIFKSAWHDAVSFCASGLEDLCIGIKNLTIKGPLLTSLTKPLLSLPGLLGALTSPLALIVLGITAVASAFTAMMITNEEFRNSVMEVVTSIMESLASLGGAINNLFAALQPILMLIGSLFMQVIAPALAELGLLILQVFGAAISWVAEWATHLTNLVTVFVAITSLIVQAAATLWSLLQSLFTAGAAVLRGDWEGAWNTITAAVFSAWQAITDAISLALSTIASVVLSYLSSLAEQIAGALAFLSVIWGDRWNGLISAVSAAFKGILNFINGGLQQISGLFSGAGQLLVNAGRSIIEGFLNGIKNKFEAVKNFVGGIGDWIVSHKGPLPYDRCMLIPAGKAIMGGLAEGLEAGFSAVEDMVSSTNQFLVGGSFAAQPAVALAGSGAGSTTYNLYIDGVSTPMTGELVEAITSFVAGYRRGKRM